MRLKNKRAIVTAAGSGMGRAGCILFAREGAAVVIVDIDEAGARGTAEAVKAAGGTAHVIVADLLKADECQRIVHDGAKRLGGLDLLWNHAGMPGPAEVEGVDLDAYERAMSLNVRSGFLSTGAAVKYMRAAGGGSILFTASVAGLVGSMMAPVYSGAKFGVVGLAMSLAQRYAPDKIRVNALCPGLTDTPMLPQFVNRNNDPSVQEENTRKLNAAIPMGRPGRPEELAHAALWLLSDDASYVTGIALPVDGGYVCR
ncbi:MAG: 2,5-dichloro-2,5-cyclohexadiene-1,4-diol dehydrogenase [Variovorax paradoxus]|nr:MAG: 2,5-dichloro-2,5-cyclohexadiene-1,4-diol dehydrogenase [Variovorax paradoxus]PZQ05259.1 MAG: 2,5-dichloro-2,5-cyclohexadiene-1,4-diol dehydrogenase [Variovorax paradoxus]